MKVTTYRVVVVHEEDFDVPAEQLVNEVLQRHVEDDQFCMVGATKEKTIELDSNIKPNDVVNWIEYADSIISRMVN